MKKWRPSKPASPPPTSPQRADSPISVDQEVAVSRCAPWLPSMYHSTEIDLHWLLVTMLMLGSGLIFFGWRSMIVVSVTALATVAVYVVLGILIHYIRRSHRQDSSLYALWMGLLLGLCLPVVTDLMMPAMMGAGLGVALHAVGRMHRVRAHPIAIVIIAFMILPAVLMETQDVYLRPIASSAVHSVLRPDYVVVGDVTHTTAVPETQPWVRSMGAEHALRRQDQQLLILRWQRRILENPNLLMRLLSSGDLVRLEEVLAGAVPGPIGTTSAALLIFLGLLTMYRRLAWWQPAVAALLTGLIVYLLLPIHIDGELTAVGGQLLAMGPANATTLLSYLLLGTGMPLIVLILAPHAAPLSRIGRLIYGIVLGGGLVLTYWIFRTPESGYLALLAASLISRPLDGLHRSEFTGWF